MLSEYRTGVGIHLVFDPTTTNYVGVLTYLISSEPVI